MKNVKRNVSRGLSALAIALLLAPLAPAQPGDDAPPPPPPGQDGGPGGGGPGGERREFNPQRFFERMDQNGDGKISKDEFRFGDEGFAQADTNKDGSISSEEFAAGAENMRRRGPGGPGRLKERLGATDEEWSVLEPKIQAVNDLRAKTSPFGGFGRGGRGGRGEGGPGGRGEGGPGERGGRPEQLPELRALNEAVDNKENSAEDLKAKIDAYRAARDKNEAAIKTAREELRGLTTTRQEAILIAQGILD